MNELNYFEKISHEHILNYIEWCLKNDIDQMLNLSRIIDHLEKDPTIWDEDMDIIEENERDDYDDEDEDDDEDDDDDENEIYLMVDFEADLFDEIKCSFDEDDNNIVLKVIQELWDDFIEAYEKDLSPKETIDKFMGKITKSIDNFRTLQKK